MGKRETMGFPGGIHPADGADKALTMEKPVRTYLPRTVTILSEQSPGGTCAFTVKPKDRVEEGSLIGEPKAFLAAPLHASVSGVVKEIREVTDRGRSILSCVIERDREPKTEQQAYETEAADLSGITREDIVRGLQQGGLSGMGGAGFPTSKKYETEKSIDTLLINGAECEPYLTCDYRLMLEKTWGVVNGARLLLKASKASKAYICLEDNKMQAAEKLNAAIQEIQEKGISQKEPVEVCVLPARYPQGGERQLIQSVLQREVPAGGLPSDVGVIVSNAATAKAAADQILGGQPLTKRIVTVTGCVKEPGNYLVPIGTSAGELLHLCGGVTEKESRILAGGPMTGICAASCWDGESDLFYITKSTSGILVLPNRGWQEQPCIRCGGCQRVCPAGLVPWQIDFAFLEEDYDLCESLFASECIACGCCSYICPAKRELTLRNRLARDLVKQRRRERAVKQS